MARRLIVIGTGFILPVACMTAYFLWRNAFQPFLEGSLLYNFAYAGGNANLLGAMRSGLLSLGFAAGVGLLGVALAASELPGQVAKKTIDPLILWLCLDVVIELGLSGLSGRNYPHYFMSWLPWIAFGSALVISKALPASAHWRTSSISWGLIAASIMLLAANSATLGEYWKTGQALAAGGCQVQREELVPKYVNEHSEPHETVLAWGGEVSINFLARRDAPTAYIFYPGLVRSKITDRMAAEYFDDIRAHPPTLIVDPSPIDGSGQIVPLATLDPVKWSEARGMYAAPYLAELFELVHENYEYKTSVAGMAIYRLKSK